MRERECEEGVAKCQREVATHLEAIKQLRAQLADAQQRIQRAEQKIAEDRTDINQLRDVDGRRDTFDCLPGRTCNRPKPCKRRVHNNGQGPRWTVTGFLIARAGCPTVAGNTTRKDGL